MERKRGRPYLMGAPLVVKIPISLTQDQSDALDEIAVFLGRHRADLLREAIGDLIEAWQKPT